MSAARRLAAGVHLILSHVGPPMMIAFVRIAAWLVACQFAAGSMFATPAHAADIATGERIAARWCAACHAVGRGQPNTRTEAASFLEIALIPEFNERQLAFFLLDPHPKMPDMSLTRAEAADLAAYIHSLGN